MNRAERRRQAKRKQSTLVPPPTLAAIKATLQQLTSPAQIQVYLNTLLAQGFPPAAGDELQVYAAEFHDATDMIRHGTDTDTLPRLVANAHSWADTIIAQSRQKSQCACHAGCAWCCYLPVVLVAAAEALYLAAWLRSHCSESELDALRHRLAVRIQRQREAPSDAPQSPLACPLLRNNRCMAYEVRPLKCRGWNSLRLTDCEQAYGHGSSARRVLIDTHAFVMGNAVLNGLSDGVTKAGLDGTHYELCHALTQALAQARRSRTLAEGRKGVREWGARQ